MSVVALATENAVPINLLGRRVTLGLERAKRAGRDEWVNGSIEAAVALYEARQRFGTNHRAFGGWLKTQDFTDLHQNDRMALIHFGADSVKARAAFEQTSLRQYRLIWQEVRGSWGYIPVEGKHRGKYRDSATVKQPPKPVGTSRRTGSYAEINRKLKLGDDYARLTNTSLGTQKEMDALIALKQGYPDVANKLVERALSGERVSARAVCDDKDRNPEPTIEELMNSWTRHTLHMWLRASPQVRAEFLKKIGE